MNAIEFVGVHKWFGSFHVLRNIDLEVRPGERIVVCGPSGSGKSTLLRCVNRLEEHQRGTIRVDGIELTADVKRIDEVRREVGMVFQQFNLFPHLTILENCTLAPIWVRKMPRREAEEVAMTFLGRVKIPEQAHKYPGQLSGGQQQRVAVARAVAGDPLILLADEPTGNLDSQNGEAVMGLLRELHEGGATICMVTHDPRFARHAKRAVHLFDGRVVEDEQGAKQSEDERKLTESGFGFTR
jgi:general L-amino acid transport system ATP-binding protein